MNARKNSIFRAGLLVALFALFSKCLGFLRETLIAAYFGATAETDAFFLAQNMPAMIFPAVCTSISTAFISLYVLRLTEKGERCGDRYASRMLWASLLLSIVLSVAGIVCAPLLVPLFAPGFSQSQVTLATHLTRLTMAAFPLTMLQYMLSAILNAKKLFIGSQVAGLLYNIVIIAVTVVLGSNQSLDTLTLTIVTGVAVQVLILVICCRGKFHATFRISPIHPDTRQLIRLTLPILLGNSIVQINSIVDKALGSTLPEGSLSALSYGNTLSGIVINVLIVSLSTVLYPTLTSDASTGDMETYGATLHRSLNVLSAILVPVTFITVLSAPNIVSIVYERGNFQQEAVAYTTIVLSCYAPMFVASGIREILTRGFFALQDSKTPMRNSAIGVGCNIVFSLAFVRWLGIAGIALGTSLSAYISAVLLFVSMHRRFPKLRLPAYCKKLLVQCLAGLVMAGVLVLFHRWYGFSSPLLQFAADTVVGAAVYFPLLFLTGFKKR